MKIGESQSMRSRVANARRVAGLLMVTTAFLAGLLVGRPPTASHLWQALGTLPDRLTGAMGPADELPTLTLDMDFAAYDDLLTLRAQAIADGVYIPADKDFVEATIRITDGMNASLSPVSVMVRLPEGPTGYLVNKNDTEPGWAFEVHTRQEERLWEASESGWQTFTLFPLGNEEMNEDMLTAWAFQQALAREDILTVGIRFVHLVFNGADRGVYALREGFGDPFPTDQGRPAGVALRFDVRPLWESILHFQGDAEAAFADPVARLWADDFHAFTVSVVYQPEETVTREQVERAVSLLRAVHRGEITASAAFDVERYGRFLALADLWGVSEAVSPVSARYFYHPIADRLEPVGFDAIPHPKESGARLPLSATFGDPLIQAAYIRAAYRLSQPDYLATLRTEIEPRMERLRRGIGEVGQSGLWEALAEHQALLRQSLSPAQPVMAYLDPTTSWLSGTLSIEVENAIALPVEIVAFEVGGATTLPADRRWLRTSARATPVTLPNHPEEVILPGDTLNCSHTAPSLWFDIPLQTVYRRDRDLDWLTEPEIVVLTRVVGLTAVQRTVVHSGVLPVEGR